MTFSQLFEILYKRYQKLFLSVDEVALELNISPKTARNWLHEDCFPLVMKKIRGRRLASISSLCLYYLEQLDSADAVAPMSVLPSTADQSRRTRGRPPKSVDHLVTK